jgi:hypothetical protein
VIYLRDATCYARLLTTPGRCIQRTLDRKSATADARSRTAAGWSSKSDRKRACCLWATSFSAKKSKTPETKIVEKSMSWTKKLLFYAIALTLGVITSESLIWLAAQMSEKLQNLIYNEPLIIRSEKLGRIVNVGNPKHAEIDINGYRNTSVLERYKIVVLGDSNVFGAGVSAESAWPYIVGSETGCSTYNMGIGGYGQIHSYLQLDEALSFKPYLVIVGVYFGNDLIDNFEFNYKGKILDVYDEDIIERVKSLEKSSPIREKIADLFGTGRKEEASYFRRFLSENSGIYGLARALKNVIRSNYGENSTILAADFETAVSALTDSQRKYTSIYDGGDWKTILAPRYRLPAQDRNDPRVELGFRLALGALLKIKERLDSEHVKMLVVLLPTKTFVFSSHVKELKDHKGFSSLVEWEKTNRTEIMRFLTDNKIDFVDPAVALMHSEPQPYFANADGHPNEQGHRVIADEVKKKLVSILE